MDIADNNNNFICNSTLSINMEVIKEGAFLVYRKEELVAIIKRDNLSSKHLVYIVKEASSDDIAELISNKNHE